jgi:hypothetical protein
MGNRLGLLTASFIERYRAMTLNAACGIPFGFAVANEDQFGHDEHMIL